MLEISTETETTKALKFSKEQLKELLKEVKLKPMQEEKSKENPVF